MKKITFIVLFCTVFILGGCSSKSEMKNGFYTAEMQDYSHGWKEYLRIMVKNNTIVYAEFNAKNPSGYIKAWDNTYMRNMLTVNKTYPNEYTRNYTAQLINIQNSNIDALTGATNSANNFKKLTTAVIEQAKKGDSNTFIVK